MPDKFEPDSQFVDKLEWQLASEFRRMDRLKPAVARVAVPRRVVALSLAAGVLLMGVAATKAADLIKDSWRKKIEVARLETAVKLKKAFLEFYKDMAARTEAQASKGLVHEDDYLGSKLMAERSALDLERSMLDLEEAKHSGEAPRNELHAPTVGGRDFVNERLLLEKSALELDLARRTRIGRRLQELIDKGLAPRSDLDGFLAALADQEAGMEEIEKRLDLRRRFLAGEISALELEIRDRTSAAEKDLRQARSRVDHFKKRLDLLRAREAEGVIAKTEIEQVQFGLDAAQAELDLAIQEIEILKKIR